MSESEFSGCGRFEGINSVPCVDLPKKIRKVYREIVGWVGLAYRVFYIKGFLI